MILIIGGTTEGRNAAAAVDRENKPFFYSTRDGLQTIDCTNAIMRSGAMDVDGLSAFIRDKDISLIVDAGHPFAASLHDNVARAGSLCGIPTVRYERRYPKLPTSATVCNDMADAVGRLKENPPVRLLALTGVQTIASLKPYWTEHETFFRILDRDISRKIAAKTGFPADHIIYYSTNEDDLRIFNEYLPDAIITKESGESGFFADKIDAAEAIGAKVFVIRRPPLPSYDATVTGPMGLRRAIERLLPDFYSLKSGLTTGTCAAAAAQAATRLAFLDESPAEVAVTLPDGEDIIVRISEYSAEGEMFTAVVVKESGDDPDVTNGCHVRATVRRKPNVDIEISGGRGIGRVTLPGLGLPVGSPAINKVPLEMIRTEIQKIADRGVAAEISIDEGEELALRTFNPKVGVVGGISVIGTKGVVMPFSNEAFIESIRREISVAKAMNLNRIVINSGANSQETLKQLYPDLPPQGFIHYGNAIGDTLDALRQSFDGSVFRPEISMGLMIGKAAKLAEGHFNTHSHNVEFNRDFLREIARQAGCSTAGIEALSSLKLAREIYTLLPDDDLTKLSHAILSLCHRHASQRMEMPLTIHLISQSGSVVATLPA